MRTRWMAWAVLAIGCLSCGGAQPEPATTQAVPSVATQTAQANLLLYPTSDPEALLGRAVHLTGHNAWSTADERAPGCEVAVKRQPSSFNTHRQVDLHSMTALVAGLPALIGIEAKYGRSVVADIDIENTEILEANVSPRCRDVVVDKVFVGSGKRQLVVKTAVGGGGGTSVTPVPLSASHESGSTVADSTEWREPQGYGFGTRRLSGKRRRST